MQKTASKRIYRHWLLQCMISGMVVVAGVFLLAVIMIGTLVHNSVYELYFLLRHCGLAPEAAMMGVGGVITLLVGTFTLMTMVNVERLSMGPRMLLRRPLL